MVAFFNKKYEEIVEKYKNNRTVIGIEKCIKHLQKQNEELGALKNLIINENIEIITE